MLRAVLQLCHRLVVWWWHIGPGAITGNRIVMTSKQPFKNLKCFIEKRTRLIPEYKWLHFLFDSLTFRRENYPPLHKVNYSANNAQAALFCFARNLQNTWSMMGYRNLCKKNDMRKFKLLDTALSFKIQSFIVSSFAFVLVPILSHFFVFVLHIFVVVLLCPLRFTFAFRLFVR